MKKSTTDVKIINQPDKLNNAGYSDISEYRIIAAAGIILIVISE
ncbi:MAG TPA: hypothetical protein PKA90_00905 [Ignavibacteria bacterium]|nr:hypothetical protein [Ignavibacteria bacterium]HMR38964.1 hypothetical protein [Ignavibacteria bacterium]